MTDFKGRKAKREDSCVCRQEIEMASCKIEGYGGTHTVVVHGKAWQDGGPFGRTAASGPVRQQTEVVCEASHTVPL